VVLRRSTVPVVGVVVGRVTVPRWDVGLSPVRRVLFSGRTVTGSITWRRSIAVFGVVGRLVGVMVRRPSVMPQPSGSTRRPLVVVLVVPSRESMLRRATSVPVGDARRPPFVVTPDAVGETRRPLLAAASVPVGETRRPVVAVRVAPEAVGDARRLFS